MKLSEAIRIGRTLRPETHQERFARLADGTLCSDAWGAACEAVDPSVAKLNWSHPDVFEVERAMRRLREVQEKYFAAYFRMPARCPGATQEFERARGRVVNRKGDVKIEDGAKVEDAGGITSECHLVETLAGAADHLFYAHNMMTEEVVECVEAYEEARTDSVLGRLFAHFRTPSLEKRINERLLARARRNIEARQTRRTFAA